MNNKVFDENDAIAFIRNFIPSDIKNKYSDNDILLLMDTMYDFYDEEDDEEEIADDEAYLNRIINYVKKSIRKDPDNTIEMEDVKHLVVGEIEYENTLEFI